MRPYLLLLAIALSGCSAAGMNEDQIFTLYRGSPLDANMRIHVATFDATDGEAYNRENCEIAAKVFKEQPGVTVRYFCEKGRYKK